MTKIHTLCRRTLPLCLLGGSLLLSGCETPKQPVDGHPASDVAGQEQKPIEYASELQPEPEQRDSAQMMLCQKELDALKQVAVKQHQVYQQEFSRLMRSAAQYAGVRTQVNSDTQETVDALYHYKAKRLCANISQALLTGLADMGERVK